MFGSRRRQRERPCAISVYQETQERRSNAAVAMFGIRLMHVRNDDDGWGESTRDTQIERKRV